MTNTSPYSGREFNIGRVKGRPVIDSNGDNVGTIEDVVVEPGTWKVSGFVVNVRREIAESLHLQRKGFLDSPRIEITSDRIRSVGDNVILNIDRTMIAEALGGAPLAHGEPVTGEFRGHIDEYPPPGVGAFEPPRY